MFSSIILISILALVMGLWIYEKLLGKSLQLNLTKSEEYNQSFIQYIKSLSSQKALSEDIQSLLELVMKLISAKGLVLRLENMPERALLESCYQLGDISLEKLKANLKRQTTKKEVKDTLFSNIEKNGISIGYFYAELKEEGDEEWLKKVIAMMINQIFFFLENHSLQRELKEDTIRFFGEIQKGWLPNIENSLKGFKVSARSIPSSRFNGDFYDSIRIDDYHCALVLSDVATKGLFSLLISGMCRTAIRSLVDHIRSPLEILCRLNEVLYPEICGKTIISLIYLFIDEKLNTVTMARAGHEMPIFCRKGKIEKIDLPGICLGIDEGKIFNKMVKEQELKLQSGDFLLLFTDGLVEAVNKEGAFFGRERAEKIVQEMSEKDPDIVLSAIVEQLKLFCKETAPFDDVTLLALSKN